MCLHMLCCLVSSKIITFLKHFLESTKQSTETLDTLNEPACCQRKAETSALVGKEPDEVEGNERITDTNDNDSLVNNSTDAD